ncbi:Tetratricopeptide repeat protein 1 [Zalerion maritima]|uniref:Tetratricopeptide repeat protein 1 n=1 Tax=Zalerion maritima TaxID=339359 RepID=A0AAD5RW71_9PEZI|nr:Tetratricopeptide repeat protein 1 [Zalerion maritima]
MSASGTQGPASDRKSAQSPKAEGQEEATPRFTPEEEAALVEETSAYKAIANKLFAASKYEEAISSYKEALSSCPNYLHYDSAVLRSNLSACYLKLQKWKEAIKEASDSLDSLVKSDQEVIESKEKTEPQMGSKSNCGANDKKAENQDEESDVEEEIVSQGATKAGPAVVPEKNPVKGETPSLEELKRRRQDDIKRIRAKALMRRARARSELGGWSNLSGAEEDYKTLWTMDNLGPAEKQIIATQLRILPPRAKEAQEKETAEMLGKLKDLGNGILKPFGLSTDNFQMEKDEKSGGYSMNFKQG